MTVAPHPHTGLQTVSWLFAGEIEHRDSAGHHAMVRPGALNLMTAGRGISHSEISTPAATRLHGAQLWVALPAADRAVEPGFAHYEPEPVQGAGWQAQVFLGSLLGQRSPVPTYTPLLGAELRLEPHTTLVLDVDSAFEFGVLPDSGAVAVNGSPVDPAVLAYVAPGARHLSLTAYDEPVSLLLLGGPPFGEEILMWWNFVGRSHEEILAFRTAWHEQIVRGGDLVADGQDVAPGPFGIVAGEHLPPIPAPTLPNTRLKPRR
jgi:redox-sensitive bicupin YhaK (pirin superfamily)